MAAPTAGILDAFSEADGSAPPSASWTRLQSATADLTVVAATGRVKLPSGTNTANYWNVGTFGPDSEVYVTVPVLPAVASSVVLYLRLQGTPSSARNGYGVVYTQGSPGTFAIRRYTASVGTTLVGPTNQSITAGQKLWFSAVGNILTAYYFNGTAWVSVNSYDITPDATKYTTAGYVAVGIADTTVRLDDFGGGATSATVTGASATTFSLNIGSTGVRTRLGASTSTYSLNVGSAGVRTRFGSSTVPLTLNIGSAGVRTRFGSSTVPLALNIASAGERTAVGAASLGLLLNIASAGVRTGFGVSSSTYTFNIGSSGARETFGAASLPLLLSIFSDATLERFGSASLTETFTFSSQGIRGTTGQSSLTILFGIDSVGRAVEFGSASMTILVGIDSEGTVVFVFPAGPAGSLASPHAGSIAGSRNGRIAQPLAGTLN